MPVLHLCVCYVVLCCVIPTLPFMASKGSIEIFFGGTFSFRLYVCLYVRIRPPPRRRRILTGFFAHNTKLTRLRNWHPRFFEILKAAAMIFKMADLKKKVLEFRRGFLHVLSERPKFFSFEVCFRKNS